MARLSVLGRDMRYMPPSHEEGGFDLDVYLRGFLGSVVRFGAASIHGQSISNRQYAGWGVHYIGHRDGQRLGVCDGTGTGTSSTVS